MRTPPRPPPALVRTVSEGRAALEGSGGQEAAWPRLPGARHVKPRGARGRAHSVAPRGVQSASLRACHSFSVIPAPFCLICSLCPELPPCGSRGGRGGSAPGPACSAVAPAAPARSPRDLSQPVSSGSGPGQPWQPQDRHLSWSGLTYSLGASAPAAGVDAPGFMTSHEHLALGFTATRHFVLPAHLENSGSDHSSGTHCVLVCCL